MSRTNAQKRILLIDDDKSLLEILALQLRTDNYVVSTASTGLNGLEQAATGGFDAIVLDMGLPDLPGTEVCQRIRTGGVLVPILILSGNSNKSTIVNGLESGADDYLVKPFYQDELKARLSALIRRDRRIFPAKQLQASGLTLNLADHTLSAASESISLTSLETAVLKCLMQRAPDVVLREYFFEEVWGINDEHTSNRLDVYIKRVRQKLHQLGPVADIQTVHSKGYRLSQ